LKAGDLKPSLSILVPVHNAQAQLHGCVQRLLDVLPELNGRFEVLIVDDGSTDATCEVGYELARDYPQVKVSRHATSVGWAATVAKHANNATSEFLMIHCGGAIEADDIISLWRWRYKISASAVRPGTPHNGKSWRLDSESETGWQDVGKIRFTTLLDGCCIHAGATKSNFLLLKRQQLPRLEKCLAEIPRSSRIDSSGVRTPQSFQKAPPGSGIKPPSFLNQLKTFTLGE
jgi:glycosyltransferase involved in cell wall biosynthesis